MNTLHGAMARRLLPVFITEAGQCLDEIDEAVLALSKDLRDGAAREQLARAAHTIKGNAAALGLRSIVIEAQLLESWSRSAPNDRAAGMPAALHGARTALRSMITQMSSDSRNGTAP
jgi:chemotaxis protein histidine kinase CheA